jgi:hypothetical protein
MPLLAGAQKPQTSLDLGNRSRREYKSCQRRTVEELGYDIRTSKSS